MPMCAASLSACSKGEHILHALNQPFWLQLRPTLNDVSINPGGF